MAQKDEPTAGEVARIQAWLDTEQERKSGHEEPAYDGVLGLPPGWVPAPVTERFRQLRDRVLDDWKYTPEQAAEWLDRYTHLGEDDDDWFFPGRYPNSRELEPKYFLETIGFLANLRWAVSLGRDRGLKELAGVVAADAALGHSVRKGALKERKDALRVLTETTRMALRNLLRREPSAREVLQHLEDYDNENEFARTIQEIDWDDDIIFWCDRRGQEKKTKFCSFNDRLTRIRKAPR